MTEQVELTEFEIEAFEYLDELRESGVTNMFGAGSYLEDFYGLDKKEASRILVKWMSNFSG